MAATTVDTSMWGLYVHQAKDGTLTVVDSAGKAIATPPNIEVGADGGFAVVDTSGSAISGSGGEPITLPAYSPPIHNVYTYTASDGTVMIVDPSGKPVPTPPDTTKTPSGDLVVVDSSGQVVEGVGGPVEIPPYVPPTSNVYVYTASDGTTTIVDAVGHPVSSPPLVGAEGNIVGVDGKDVLDPTSGNPITVPAYLPPTANIYGYISPSGSIIVVDGAGNPVPSPPRVNISPFSGEIVVGGTGSQEVVDPTTGGPITLPRYVPPTANVYVYTNSSGWTFVVDAAGNRVSSPPRVDKEGVVIDQDGKAIVDPSTGDPVTLPPYSPPMSDVYLHTAPNGKTTVVDAAGNPVSSPPFWGHANETLVVFVGSDGQPVLDGNGNPIPVPAFEPTTAPRLLVHIAADGTPEVVEATGKTVSSPPHVAIDSKTGEPVVMNVSGEPLLDAYGNPISLPLFSPPTQGVYAHVMRDPVTGAVDVQIVDAAGNLVPSPPGYTLKPSADPSDPPVVLLTGSDGKPLIDSSGSSISAPLFSPPTQGVYAHVMRDPVTGAVDVQIVDAAGNLVPSPPGYTLKPSADPSDPPVVLLTGSDGKPLIDSSGSSISAPLFSPPTQGVYAHVMRDPVTGAVDVQIVDAAGNLVPSPPGYTLKPSADPSDPPVVLLTGSDGKPLIDSSGSSISAPLFSPPTQGVYAHVMRDPVTGAVDVQIVDAAGNLVPSPPGYTLKPSADPSDPPVVLLTGSDGKPLIDSSGSSISAPLFSPPTQGVYAHVMRDPVTGAVDVQIVDAAGNLVPSPPGYLVTGSGETGQENPVVTLTGADGKPLLDEDGNPISVPLHPSSANPPGAPPPAGEDADVADLPGEDEDETAEVAEDTDTEGTGEPGQAETGAGDGAVGVEEEATSEGRSADLGVEVEPTVSEVREVSTREAEEPSVASAEPGTAVVEVEHVGLVGEDLEDASARIGGAATPEIGESMEIGAMEAIGPVGLGVEELAEMVSGRGAEEIETAAREVAGPSVDGGQALDIPDLGPLELDGKGVRGFRNGEC